ncbi:Mitochondrial amidoxime-reducing component 1 [Cyberlindnera fabianii]|uniref:Mitochondrial amidoxime-reducing component 1 n=1 Tax=Cyberlindnera fabianii TaxID=36022 RepID=A0A1V2KZD1_CYBFA|nr:Mitochondrial amidoxime-reducing component 1 [Cyberlindnera fabianii]
MITFVALVVILLGSFVFLPQVSEAVGVTVGDPTGAGQVLRFLLNVRYKLIALAHFNKPQFTGRVDQIFVHPLKSGGYISVKEWPVDHQGFKNFIITLHVKYSDEYIKTHSDGITESTTNLWGVRFESISIGKALPQSFRDSMTNTTLSRPHWKLSLTGSPPELPQLRKTNFQDYYPLMIMSQDEIDEVNARMKAKGSNRYVTASNFRPNIVVKGLGKSIDDMFKFRIRDPKTNSTHY